MKYYEIKSCEINAFPKEDKKVGEESIEYYEATDLRDLLWEAGWIEIGEEDEYVERIINFIKEQQPFYYEYDTGDYVETLVSYDGGALMEGDRLEIKEISLEEYQNHCENKVEAYEGMQKKSIKLKESLEVKRFYFDGKLEVDCPGCKSKMTRDFSDDYLSYPTFGDEQTWYFYCNECDDEFEMPGRLEATIDIHYDLSKIKKV